MNERDRLLDKAYELDRRADAETVPRKTWELRKRAERLRLDAINMQVEPLGIIHAVTVICLGIILIIAFGVVCFDVIGGLM